MVKNPVPSIQSQAFLPKPTTRWFSRNQVGLERESSYRKFLNWIGSGRTGLKGKAPTRIYLPGLMIPLMSWRIGNFFFVFGRIWRKPRNSWSYTRFRNSTRISKRKVQNKKPLIFHLKHVDREIHQSGYCSAATVNFGSYTQVLKPNFDGWNF